MGRLLRGIRWTALLLVGLAALRPVDGLAACVAGCECDAGGQVVCANLNAARLPALLDELTSAANNQSITKLSVRQCEDALGQLPDFPQGLRVRSLEISSCGLTDLNATTFASTAADLIELRLMNNSLKTVPFLAHFSNLQTLNLNRNDLETVPEKSLEGLNNLVQLRLKKNRICSLPPKALDDVKERLELLDLSLNCLPAVPARNLRNFKILKHLDLSSNQLVELGDFQFMNLPELKEIRLNDNRIANFSARSFVNAAQVSHLYLRNNLLEAVDPAVLQNFKHLEHIDLSGNRLQKIPAFNHLASLKAVNLENNKVEKVDTLTFSNNPKLLSINLKGNQISLIARNSFDDLSGILDGMPKLQLLLLAKNTIGELTNSSFASLPELTFIDLANNKLQAIRAGTFVNQKKLYWLDLSNNRIEGVERGAFSAPVANILLDGNQLICDSSIDWFITYLVVNSIRTFHPNQSEVVCAGPEQYANVRIKDLMIKKANETLTTSMQKLGFNNVNNNNNNELQRNNFLASLLPALSGMGAGGATSGGNAPLLGALAKCGALAAQPARRLERNDPRPERRGGAGKGLESAVEQFAEPLVRFSTGAQPAASDVSTLIKSIPNLIVNLPGYGNIDISKVHPKIIEHVMKGGTLPGVPKESMDSVVKQIMQRVYAAAAHAQNQPIDQEVASNLPASGIDYKKYLRPLSELPETFVTSVMKGEPLPFLTPSQTEVVKGYYTQSIPVEAIGGPAMNLTDLATPGAMRMLKLLPPGYNISRIPADVIQGAMRGELPDITRLPSDLQNYIKDNWEKTFMALGNTPDVSVDEILKKLPKFDTVELTTFAPYDINQVDSDLVVKNEAQIKDMRMYVAIALGLVSVTSLTILVGFCFYIRKLKASSTIYDANK
ncbi:Leucine Rich repeat-containing domain protein [Aphelenchoides fujianensis]|nr:Leucine Rich repeat-containing domain protein [Aphelenchoides fujianensis]